MKMPHVIEFSGEKLWWIFFQIPINILLSFGQGLEYKEV
jgi:hypothetical protein